MSITPLDIQTSVSGSQSVSEARGRDQAISQIRQTNPQGEIKAMEQKTLEEVNEYDADHGINPDDESETPEQKKRRREKKDEENKKMAKPISDGIRGRAFDFRA
jgi:hypothetical protein